MQIRFGARLARIDPTGIEQNVSPTIEIISGVLSKLINAPWAKGSCSNSTSANSSKTGGSSRAFVVFSVYRAFVSIQNIFIYSGRKLFPNKPDLNHIAHMESFTWLWISAQSDCTLGSGTRAHFMVSWNRSGLCFQAKRTWTRPICRWCRWQQHPRCRHSWGTLEYSVRFTLFIEAS